MTTYAGNGELKGCTRHIREGLFAAEAPWDPRVDGEPTGDRVGSAYVYTVEQLFGGPVSTEPVSAAGSVELRPAYPNPAQESVTFRFNLEEPTDVTLTLFDVLGRRVATLAEGAHAAGETVLNVDLDALPAGVYFYRLEAGGRVQSGRFTRF